jgi:hypothetical protein
MWWSAPWNLGKIRSRDTSFIFATKELNNKRHGKPLTQRSHHGDELYTIIDETLHLITSKERFPLKSADVVSI